ncbi:hypothetical protein LBMAG43_07600 [Methylococcaceae bacterium]|nr:hypothetical protein LBMAG43_07600 [Methylococcaceae bacterium]
MNYYGEIVIIYLYICKYYKQTLCAYSQRMRNSADLSFTDEEVRLKLENGVHLAT